MSCPEGIFCPDLKVVEDVYNANLAILREALERIVDMHFEHPEQMYKDMQSIARDALLRAGMGDMQKIVDVNENLVKELKDQ